MRHRKRALVFFCALLCLVAVYVPLLIGGYALAVALEALWHGQETVVQSALPVAAICGIAWLSPVLAWYITVRLHNGGNA